VQPAQPEALLLHSLKSFRAFCGGEKRGRAAEG
jgi:hypothetical protein